MKKNILKFNKSVWIIIDNIGKLDVFTNGEFVLLKRVKIDGIKFCEGNNIFYTAGNLEFEEKDIYENFETAFKIFNCKKKKIKFAIKNVTKLLIKSIKKIDFKYYYKCSNCGRKMLYFNKDFKIGDKVSSKDFIFSDGTKPKKHKPIICNLCKKQEPYMRLKNIFKNELYQKTR